MAGGKPADWWKEGQNGIISYRRTSARRILLFILAARLAIRVTTIVEGVSDNHCNTHPPPQWASMLEDLERALAFKQQHASEQDLHGLHHDVDLFTDHAIRTMTTIEEGAKYFKQRLLEMRRGIKNQYTDHHPCPEAAAGPSDQAHTSTEECPDQTHKFKLCFNGSLKSTIYTNKPLTAQSNTGIIEIAICRDDQFITSGHLASPRVEIVALEKNHACKVNWTEEDFDRQIRKSRDGQGSVLDGERLVKLVNGRASLGNIRFKEGSTGTRSREFVLAARVCRNESNEGLRVEEAFMHPPFTVLVERSKGNEKSILPKLEDKVHVLKGIGRNGCYAKRLEKKNIYTVQEFLKALNKGPNNLHEILQPKALSSWETIVEHAKQCDLREKHGLKSYNVETEHVSLFFNCVDDLVGAKFRGLFVAKDKFDAAQKVLVDMQLEQAYSKLDAITFAYVMENNHPVRISTNIDAATSTESMSIPTLLGASPQNAPGHQATLQAAGNSSPYGSGIDCAPGLLLGVANWNAAWQSASEPSRPLHFNRHPNQGLGQNEIPNHGGGAIWPNTMQCLSEGTFVAQGMPILCPQAHHGGKSIPTLLGASPQNASGHQATLQAGNSSPYGSGIDRAPGLPLGYANRDAAGQIASEPSRPLHRNGHANHGEAIWPNTASSNVTDACRMDEIWNSVDESQQANNIVPDCSPGGISTIFGDLQGNVLNTFLGFPTEGGGSASYQGEL